MSNIFEYNSYKIYLSSLIKANSKVRGFQSQLAKAAGCQPSYLSQVLSSKIELTPDHAFGISGFLHFDENETEYFMNLVLHSRAVQQPLKTLIEKKMEQIRDNYKNLSKRVSLDSPENENLFYYSSWIYLAIHMVLGITEYQTEEALVARFGVDRNIIIRALRHLQRYGLAEFSQGKWLPKKRESHLPSDSFMTEVNHGNWRARALLDIQKDPAKWIHYTSVFTMTRKDAEVLRTMVLEFIDNCRRHIHPSKDEEVFCLLTDFFQI